VLKNVEPNIALAGTIMALKGQIPERTKETARMVVKAVADKIEITLIRNLQRGSERLRYKLYGAESNILNLLSIKIHAKFSCNCPFICLTVS